MKTTVIRLLLAAIIGFLPVSSVLAIQMEYHETVKEKNADGIELTYDILKLVYTDGNGEYHTSYTCTLIHDESYRYNVIGRLTIPERVRDLPVGMGQGAFAGCPMLTEVDVPYGIADHAFANCTQLSRVNLSEEAYSIGAYAFSGCTALEELDIPPSVNLIREWAFAGCTNLKKINGLQLWTCKGACIFNDCPELSFDFSTASGEFGLAFQSNKYITDVALPEGVTSIAEKAFVGCTSLKSLKLPSTLTKVGTQAFLGCINLQSVEGLDLSIDLGVELFAFCSNLTSLDFGSAQGKIPGRAFAAMSGLKSAVLPEGVTEIGGYAFYRCSSLAHVVIPNTVTKIGDNAFVECESLEEVVVPATVEKIGHSIFHGCTDLRSASVPMLVSGMFGNCPQLKEVTLTGEVKYIPQDTFYGCASLESFTIPASIRMIDENAFAECDNLKTVYSYVMTPFPMSTSSFSATAKADATLYVPAGTRQLYEATSGWEFKNIVEMDAEQGICATLNNKGKMIKEKCYDLQGRRIDNGQWSIANGRWKKGVYIRDGRKMVVP